MTDDALKYQLSEAAKIIQFMIPFLDKKAAESGDVAGIQLNARQFLSAPIVVRARVEAANEPAKDEVLRSAKSLLANWDEFGPDGGFEAYLDALRTVVNQQNGNRT